MHPILIGALIVTGVISIVVLFIMGHYVSLWLQLLLSGTPTPFINLVLMRQRGVDVKVIVFNRIRAHKAGIEIPIEAIEVHWLAGGNVTSVVQALIIAQEGGLPITWKEAAALDLIGDDAPELVRSILRGDLPDEAIHQPPKVRPQAS